MKIISGGRQSGKTTAIIKRCAKEGGYIVCHSFDEAYRIHAKAKEMGLKINFPISFSEFIQGHYAKRIEKLYIDNVDMLIQRLSSVPVDTITYTEEDE